MPFVARLNNISKQIFEQKFILGISGGGFQHGQKLEEKCWQSEPNLARENWPEHGFGREKKVVDDDKHVLYVQWKDKYFWCIIYYIIGK